MRLRWTADAVEDLASIREYIGNYNPKAANKG